MITRSQEALKYAGITEESFLLKRKTHFMSAYCMVQYLGQPCCYWTSFDNTFDCRRHNVKYVRGCTKGFYLRFGCCSVLMAVFLSYGVALKTLGSNISVVLPWLEVFQGSFHIGRLSFRVCKVMHKSNIFLPYAFNSLKMKVISAALSRFMYAVARCITISCILCMRRVIE